MPNPTVNRKSAFKAALLLSGHSMTTWAETQGVTLQHLSSVLHSRRDSNRLNTEIDVLILRYVTPLIRRSA